MSKQVFLFLFLNALLSVFSGSIAYSRLAPPDDSLRVIEKVYLMTDRDFYSPGDDIWFKAFLVEGVERFPTEHSRNLHVELISPGNKIIASRVVRMNCGIGNGDFSLPAGAVSGKYAVRAYTNYMRNFGEDCFFKKLIHLIGSEKAVRDSSGTSALLNHKPDITFFPEGGSLADNVGSLVAFKALDQWGKSLDISGRIFSSHGDTVASFSSRFKGMGYFDFVPSHGEKYFALISDIDGDTLRCKLPDSFGSGFVLHAASVKPGSVDLVIKTNRETLSSVRGHDLSLSVSARDYVFKSVSFRIKSLNSHMTLATNDLPDGITCLTLFDAAGKPVCQRLVFISNNDDAIRIITDKTEYGLRDSVSVRISLTGSHSSAREAFMGFSAADLASDDSSDPYPETIASWFLLQSDLRGDIEDPAYYFDESNADRLKDLDLLLLTHGWRDFRWKYDSPEYPVENGFTFSGKVRKKLVDEPLENVTVTMGFFNGKKPVICLAPIDSSGKFIVSSIDITSKTNLIASVTNEKNRLRGWLILDSVSYTPPEILKENPSQDLTADEFLGNKTGKTDNTVRKYAGFARKNELIKKNYTISDTVKINEVVIKPWMKSEVVPPKERNLINLRTLFPDREITMTPDLEIYNTIEQLLRIRYHINYSETRTSGQGHDSAPAHSFQTSQLPGVNSCNNMNNPLTLLDGAETKPDAFLFMPLSWVERIDVLCPITGELEWGERGNKGVVSILLKDDAFLSGPEVVYHSVNKLISGFDEPRIFYSPRHHESLREDKKPDLRTTLFWDPDIRLIKGRDSCVGFFNADNPSAVRIKVEGITDNGIPFSARTEYNVVKK